ncbi:unnamed protein product [Didymodactylos carnosus]|uniref:Uncharacterized protein n=1 Tax=Didymodactylos carnosus TaxID=1234261 RepID=A0A815HQ82_9BILA|nr:unnamed protein product [Didymodactylos carnosus]CAF1353659.1 unnamed protein product [Didymodactylos carnosus]CAF3978306.1 unnamed protein product [Didymodactylos carnosus]CAF4225850.1 unnamed protein product [Didymodactylos carnosus]
MSTQFSAQEAPDEDEVRENIDMDELVPVRIDTIAADDDSKRSNGVEKRLTELSAKCEQLAGDKNFNNPTSVLDTLKIIMLELIDLIGDDDFYSNDNSRKYFIDCLNPLTVVCDRIYALRTSDADFAYKTFYTFINLLESPNIMIYFKNQILSSRAYIYTTLVNLLLIIGSQTCSYAVFPVNSLEWVSIHTSSSVLRLATIAYSKRSDVIERCFEVNTNLRLQSDVM